MFMRDEIITLLATVGLEKYFDFYENHSSSKYLPYHNDYHTFCMIHNCYRGAIYENLSYQEMRELLTAALFHDMDHSGGKETDTENVQRAITRFFEAFDAAQTDDENFLKNVKNLIDITTYPYMREAVTLSEKIIRDSDLMQPYEPISGVLKTQYLGLKLEMDPFNKLSLAEFSKKCYEFLSNVRWETTWAKQKAIELDFPTRIKTLCDSLKE